MNTPWSLHFVQADIVYVRDRYCLGALIMSYLFALLIVPTGLNVRAASQRAKPRCMYHREARWVGDRSSALVLSIYNDKKAVKNHRAFDSRVWPSRPDISEIAVFGVCNWQPSRLGKVERSRTIAHLRAMTRIFMVRPFLAWISWQVYVLRAAVVLRQQSFYISFITGNLYLVVNRT